MRTSSENDCELNVFGGAIAVGPDHWLHFVSSGSFVPFE